jgi:ATP-binding protein involved in chromosome partitioning
MGFKVGVLDADIYGPSMPIMFDVEKPISVNVDGKSKMKPVESYDIKMLSFFHFTITSCYLERTNGFKSFEPNDL